MVNGSTASGHLSGPTSHKELYPIVFASTVWGHNWSTLEVRFVCDNQAAVHSIVAGTSLHPHTMHQLCIFLFLY